MSTTLLSRHSKFSITTTPQLLLSLSLILNSILNSPFTVCWGAFSFVCRKSPHCIEVFLAWIVGNSAHLPFANPPSPPYFNERPAFPASSLMKNCHLSSSHIVKPLNDLADEGNAALPKHP